MKKIYLFFVCVFTFGTVMNGSNFVKADCTGLALDVFDTYYDNGYSYEESYQHMNWAYEGCVNNLGYPGEEVILN